MSQKTSEWKKIKLSSENIDFSGARRAHLDLDGDSFISLTLKLRDGRTLRIRRSDYSVSVEAEVVPMETVYLVKTSTGLSASFKTRDEAIRAVENTDAKIEEMEVPVVSTKLVHDDSIF